MTQTKNAFLQKYIGHGIIFAVVALAANISSAAVVQRGTQTRAPATRPSSAAGIRAAGTIQNATTTQTAVPDEPAVDAAPVDEVVVVDKSAQFQESFDTAFDSETDGAAAARAESIKRQRDEYDRQDRATSAAARQGTSRCDTDLRTCMTEKCGKDFSQCAGDGDTDWGIKMDACRTNAQCTGHEYQLLSAEIKADRDANATLANYQATVDCGNQYNSCLVAECGATFRNCWGKVAGDAAIAKCGQKYKSCLTTDNGLAARAGEVLSTLRVDAEKQVQADEKRLYALRDEMAQACARLGAMFDERSLVCVYTVNFFANNSSTPYASKKLYAGGTFNCDQNWFGVNVTTFKENALRETETQRAVISGVMGSGLGMAAGMASSGMFNRAIDRQKAEKAVEKEKAAQKATSTTDSTGGGNEDKSYFDAPKDAGHDWYTRNCGVDSKSTNAHLCYDKYHTSDCDTYSTDSSGGCDFSGMAQVTPGAEEKCKKCLAQDEADRQCRQELLNFCQSLESELTSKKSRKTKK